MANALWNNIGEHVLRTEFFWLTNPDLLILGFVEDFKKPINQYTIYDSIQFKTTW